MRVYVRVVERSSMSEAARDLDTVQSSISERIHRLERHLGVRLLHRSSRAMTCTDEGAEFYARCKQALVAVDDAFSVLNRSKESLQGSIRIASPQCFGEVVLPQVVARIQKHHPELRVDIALNDRIVDPVTEGVDLSFRLGSTVGENLIAIRLGYIHRSLVASPRYLENHGPINEPAEIIKHPFIHVKGLFSNGNIALEDEHKQTSSIPIAASITTSHWGPMRKLILAGVGIGVIQSPGCADDLRAGRLVRLLPDYEVPKFELTGLIPASRPISPKIRTTIDFMKQCLPDIQGYSLQR